MENGIEPKRTISLNWDDPWKKYEEKWRNNPRGEGKPLLYTDISRTERPKRKKSKSKVGKRRNHQDLKLPGVSLNKKSGELKVAHRYASIEEFQQSRKS